MGFGGFSSDRRIASTGGNTSRMILREESKLSVYNMKTKNGSVWFRPWCDTFIDANGMVVNSPEREAANPEVLLPTWFGMEAICTQCGLDFKFDCVASSSDPQDWGGSSPILLFTEAARAAARNNPGLKELLFPDFKPGNTTFGGLTVGDKGVLKGALFRMDGEQCKRNINGVDQPSPLMPVLLLITMSAAKWLETACTHRNSDGTLALENVSSFASGSVLEFDYEDRILAGQDIDPTKGFSRSSAKAKGAKADGPKYHSGRVLTQHNDAVRVTDQGVLRSLHDMNEPIGTALRYMSGREQIEECLLPGFGGQLRELILSVFQARGVLPEAYVNARTFSTPAPALGGAGPAPVMPQGAGLVMPGAQGAAPAQQLGTQFNAQAMGMAGGLGGMSPTPAAAPSGMQLNPGVAAMAGGMGIAVAPQLQSPALAMPGQQMVTAAPAAQATGSPADLAAQLDSRMAQLLGGGGMSMGAAPASSMNMGGMIPNA